VNVTPGLTDDKMKICMVLSTPFPPCDGIGYHVYSLSKELIRAGHEITVITRDQIGSEQVGTLEGIKIFRGPFLPTYPVHIGTHQFWTNAKLKDLKGEFDIVHYHTPLTPVLDLDAPEVVTVHSSMIEEVDQMESGFFLKKLFLKVMTRTFTKYYMGLSLKRAKRIVAVSSSVKGEIRRFFKPGAEVVVIRNGVDTDFFSPVPHVSERKYVLYVGRLAYRKGLLELVEAFHKISGNVDADLVLCGRGVLRPHLEAMVSSYGLTDRVRFTGFVTRDELKALYQGATVFVAASAYETGPLTALEAMSCGVPVVVTKVGIMPDVVRDGESGFFVEKGNAEDLAAKIKVLLADPSMAERIGANARKVVARDCQWSEITKQLSAVYEQVILENGQASRDQDDV